MQRFGVIGHPVAHSLSPAIHQAFGRQLGVGLTYEKLAAPEDGFVQVAQQFFGAGGAGLNVTVPFKADARAWVTEATGDAASTGVVNTIAVEDGRTVGHNTDGLGLVGDLQRLGVTLDNARVLMLGAGGAVQGVLPALLRSGVASITLVNRTRARADALAERLPRLQVATHETLSGAFDLVINGTSAGLSNTHIPLQPEFAQGTVCYDMIYGAGAVFHSWALELAAQSYDGLGMLVGQAAEAFAIWHGVRPDVAPVLEQLRSVR